MLLESSSDITEVQRNMTNWVDATDQIKYLKKIKVALKIHRFINWTWCAFSNNVLNRATHKYSVDIQCHEEKHTIPLLVWWMRKLRAFVLGPAAAEPMSPNLELKKPPESNSVHNLRLHYKHKYAHAHTNKITSHSKVSESWNVQLK